MKRISRTEIKLEMSQFFEIRMGPRPDRVWCSECAATARMLRPVVAALVCGTSARAIYRRVEEGKLHFMETEDGLLLICLASLQAIL